MIYEETKPVVIKAESGQELIFLPVQLRELFRMRQFVGKLSDAILGFMSASPSSLAEEKTEQEMDRETGSVIKLIVDRKAADPKIVDSYQNTRKKAVEDLLELFLDAKQTEVMVSLIRNSLRLESGEECTFPGFEGTHADWLRNLDIGKYAILLGGFVDANIGAFNPLLERLGSQMNPETQPSQD